MGTTRAFYSILRQNATEQSIAAKLPMIKEKVSGTQNVMMETMKNLGIPESLLISLGNASEGNDPFAVFRKDAKWFSIFTEQLCEGYTASSRDTDFLSELFASPVIAFSLFDSDVLFISYSDKSNRNTFDIVKPNFDNMYEEFDTDTYKREFPNFLLSYCGEKNHQKLLDIWKGEYVFADERMADICTLLDIMLAYGPDIIPDGYSKIVCG